MYMTKISYSGIDELDRSSSSLAAQGEEIDRKIKTGTRSEDLLSSVANFCASGNEHLQMEKRYVRHSSATRLQSRFSHLEEILAQLGKLVSHHKSNVEPISAPAVDKLLQQWFLEHFSNAPYGYAAATDRIVPPTRLASPRASLRKGVATGH